MGPATSPPPARKHVVDAGMAHQCEAGSGDILDSVRAGADVYLMPRIQHDWNDATCVHVLRRCARR
ncbi:methyltransferase [Saccharopolyspora spinosa]|uniref:methyltransferase n=1 Tax=Saccharopolyspora spinosa TaxID=60894 RepID=UPI0037491514